MSSRMADLIIPETNTPGASAAGVPTYIDSMIARDVEQQQLVADGLRWLDAEAGRRAGKKFMDLDEDAQTSILGPLCEAADAGNSRARNVQFFTLIKKLTADGYYTWKIGLIDELGYTGFLQGAFLHAAKSLGAMSALHKPVKEEALLPEVCKVLAAQA